MYTYEKLHLANNLASLDLLAKEGFNPEELKFQQICKSLTTLYKAIQSSVLDQEMTYILLTRYLVLYNYLKIKQTDEKFVELRFGTELKKVLNQYEETKKSLERRYAEQEQVIPDKPIIEKSKEEIPMKRQRIFHDEFITCKQLFSALKKNKNILLVDARPEADFVESRIDHPNCINVPDHCITAGLSAHTLGKKLAETTQVVWERRETFDAIVLYDWNTSSDNFALKKLSKLRSSLVDWDLNRNYNEPPVILNGGYLELLQMYPTICINPRVYLSQKNNELDELLELDSIMYPTESDNKTLVMGSSEELKSLEVNQNEETKIESKDFLVEEYKALTIARKVIIQQLREQQEEKNKCNEEIDQENNIHIIVKAKKKIAMFNAEIDRLNGALDDIEKRKYALRNTLKTNYQYEIEGEKTSEGATNVQVDEDKDPEKLKNIIDEERNKELMKARALKSKKNEADGEASNYEGAVSKIPMIDRATKPNLVATHPMVEPLEDLGSGLVGLRNIRNTCYMSTLIQCLRNLPAIKHLFCSGTYANHNIRNPAAIIHELASLIRQLWTRNVRSIEPNEFYHKVGQLESTYTQGNHEDCMEFFLFLLNHLSEDCWYDISLPSVMTPKQKAWCNQFDGKNSYFIDLFYHQIRITQSCIHCHQNTYKFEIESTFMLHVPDHDFTLEELMDDYMADYVIPEYLCSRCKKPVKNSKEICFEPKIMVIVLKRYKHHNLTGNFSFSKIESKVHFQKKNFRLNHCLYQLNAIVLHSGDMNFGHYTAAALTPRGWYEFNDETVRPININDASLKVKACAFFYSMCDK